MAAFIGFGGPLIFILLFVLINQKYLTVTSGIIYSILIFVLSIGTGIGLTIMFGVGSIFSGLVAPVFYTTLFSFIVRGMKPKEEPNWKRRDRM
ncbi:MAG: hypothetical protein AB8H03_06495 [Saprospiraceae bacterium]